MNKPTCPAESGNRELEALTLPGWFCPRCDVFNGEAKEKRMECRACDLQYIRPACRGTGPTAFPLSAGQARGTSPPVVGGTGAVETSEKSLEEPG